MLNPFLATGVINIYPPDGLDKTKGYGGLQNMFAITGFNKSKFFSIHFFSIITLIIIENRAL